MAQDGSLSVLDYQEFLIVDETWAKTATETERNATVAEWFATPHAVQVQPDGALLALSQG